MIETLQDFDLVYTYNGSTGIVSFAIVSGDAIEKVKVEFHANDYEPKTYDRIAASLRAIADEIRIETELLEVELDDDSGEYE